MHIYGIWEASWKMLGFWQTGGDVSLLTFSGKLLQVLQCDFFVPRAVCQAVIDHCVLKGNKHSLVTDTRGERKGTTWTRATLQMWLWGCTRVRCTLLDSHLGPNNVYLVFKSYNLIEPDECKHSGTESEHTAHSVKHLGAKDLLV